MAPNHTMIPGSDKAIGITVYSTSFAGCGGKIRESPDDFQVAEVLSKPASSKIRSKGAYAVYLLRKRKIDTTHALAGLLRIKGVRLKALGLKDAHAVTEQYVCATGRSRAIADFESDKFSLTRIGYAENPLTKKDMLGNRFCIRIRGCSKNLTDFAEEDKVLNFYGYQRFGSRRAVTHLIGRDILRRDFEGAIERILSFTSPYDSKQNNEIRSKLTDKANYKSVLGEMPPQMDIERIVLKECIKDRDPVSILRSVPVQIRRLYVQAYQSYLFNRTLSCAFEYGEELISPQKADVCYDKKGNLGRFVAGTGQSLAVPTVGYSYFKKTRFHFYVSKILDEEEISPGDFFIKEMQESSAEGGFRNSAIQCKDFVVSGDAVAFTLGRGSFATMILRELIKPTDPIRAGF